MDLARAWTVTGPRVVATGFAVSGVVHLVRPQVFEPMIPSALPAPRALVQVSGVAEIACAAGLLRGDPWAPWASAGLLLAVWPGNWQMAIDVQRDGRHPASAEGCGLGPGAAAAAPRGGRARGSPSGLIHGAAVR